MRKHIYCTDLCSQKKVPCIDLVLAKINSIYVNSISGHYCQINSMLHALSEMTQKVQS
jgi:hypothetical protein